MKKTNVRLAVAASAIVAGLAFSTASSACPSAGLVKRIDGDPRQADLRRGGAPGPIRVLQTVCAGDVVEVGSGRVLLSVSGMGDVMVGPNNSFQLPAPRGQADYASNAYRTMDERIMPGMMRIRMEVRVKGGAEPFGFSVDSLATGGQQVSIGHPTLLVRMVGGVGPFEGRLIDSSGAVSVTRATDEALVFRGLALKPGPVTITVNDSTGRQIKGSFVATADGPAHTADYRGLEDPEVRTAVEAIDLAQTAPKTQAFEAEQELNNAPANGLDRTPVYVRIESLEN